MLYLAKPALVALPATSRPAHVADAASAALATALFTASMPLAMPVALVAAALRRAALSGASSGAQAAAKRWERREQRATAIARTHDALFGALELGFVDLDADGLKLLLQRRLGRQQPPCAWVSAAQARRTPRPPLRAPFRRR